MVEQLTSKHAHYHLLTATQRWKDYADRVKGQSTRSASQRAATDRQLHDDAVAHEATYEGKGT